MHLTPSLSIPCAPQDGRTPLHVAARYGRASIVTLLVEYTPAGYKMKDNVRARAVLQITVSLLLASYSPRSVSRVVLASRAQEGKTPADLARQYKESKWEEVSRPAGTREGADGPHTPHHSLSR